MTSKFTKLLEERKKDYRTWLPIYSPALKVHISFNSQGFNHLRFKTDNTPRNPKEAMYKMGLLALVRPVIHGALHIDTYEHRTSPVGGSRKKVLKKIEYWSIIGIVGKNKVKVRVVLRKLMGSSSVHFWSVMKG